MEDKDKQRGNIFMARRMLEIATVMFLLVWVACGTVTKKQVAMEKTTTAAATKIKDVASGKDIESQMEALFPESIGDTGWRRSDGVTIYDEKSIFKHINGAAEAYFLYGFQLCGTAEYIPGNWEASEDEFILVDVYDMGLPIQAFGMYTSELYPDSELVDIGVQGYVETPALNFWKGQYYVKIMSASMDENVTKTNMELAKHIAQNIPGKAEKPKMLSLLPDEGFVEGSESFVLKNILGHSFLKNGVMGNYQIGDEEKSLIIMDYGSEDKAQSLLSQFARYEEKTGQGMEKIADLGDGGFAVKDKYYKRIMVVRQGKYVLVVLPVSDESNARGLIKAAITEINAMM